MTTKALFNDGNLLYCLLIAFPPALSTLYIVSVQAFNAGWHECSWCHLAKPISLRVALLVVAIAILATMHYPNNEEIPEDSETDSSNSNPQRAYLLPSILMPILSVLSIYRTRKLFVQGPKPKFKNMDGKVCLITGANAGIGKETARQLLEMGATVIMACRSEQRAKDAKEDILSSMKQDKKQNDDMTLLHKGTAKSVKERLLFLECDVSNFDSVRKAVSVFNDMKLPLHILVNNAGIMMGQRKTVSWGSKSYELNMACNHLGHFLLTNLLLPKLREEEDARVIIVTSSTYVLASSGIDLDDLNCERRNYTMFSQYAQSKLANILMGKELLQREKIISSNSSSSPGGVSVFMVHPGLVRTDVVRNMPWYLKYPNIMFSFILATLQKTPAAGAYTNVFCATSDEAIKWNGEYFSNSEPFPTNKHANDVRDAEKLWQLSEDMVGLDNGTLK